MKMLELVDTSQVVENRGFKHRIVRSENGICCTMTPEFLMALASICKGDTETIFQRLKLHYNDNIHSFSEASIKARDFLARHSEAEESRRRTDIQKLKKIQKASQKLHETLLANGFEFKPFYEPHSLADKNAHTAEITNYAELAIQIASLYRDARQLDEKLEDEINNRKRPRQRPNVTKSLAEFIAICIPLYEKGTLKKFSVRTDDTNALTEGMAFMQLATQILYTDNRPCHYCLNSGELLRHFTVKRKYTHSEVSNACKTAISLREKKH